jgi:hypothetical protein
MDCRVSPAVERHAELFEYICQQNTLNPGKVMGEDGQPDDRDVPLRRFE